MERNGEVPGLLPIVLIKSCPAADRELDSAGQKIAKPCRRKAIELNNPSTLQYEALVEISLPGLLMNGTGDLTRFRL